MRANYVVLPGDGIGPEVMYGDSSHFPSPDLLPVTGFLDPYWPLTYNVGSPA